MADTTPDVGENEVVLVWKVPNNWPTTPENVHPTGELMSIHNTHDDADDAIETLEENSSMDGYRFSTAVESID